MNGKDRAGLGSLIGGVVLTLIAASPQSLSAQSVTAEVRTWSGQSWRLAGPSLELFYTIIPKPGGDGESSAPPGEAPPSGGTPSGSAPRLFGTAKEIAPLFGKQPETKHGHRQVTIVRLHRERVETQIPLDKVMSLIFSRQPVSNSFLPIYVSPLHFRYSASALMIDGSRVEGDYVNLGTIVLRGMTREGRVDIPWEEIESVRFSR